MSTLKNIYNTKEYKRSRTAYALQCTFEYFVMLLVADAFLANLLTNMGISDALTGIISSFISFAFLFQLMSIFAERFLQQCRITVTAYSDCTFTGSSSYRPYHL